MTETDELHFLGSADYQEAKRLQVALREKGIRIELVSHPEKRTSRTCKPMIEMFAREADVPLVIDFIRQEKLRDLGDLEIDPSLINEVFDETQETARCPACGDTFSTRLNECPGCGLGFGASPAGSEDQGS